MDRRSIVRDVKSCRKKGTKYDERKQPNNHISDGGRTDTGGCPHGERYRVADNKPNGYAF